MNTDQARERKTFFGGTAHINTRIVILPIIPIRTAVRIQEHSRKSLLTLVDQHRGDPVRANLTRHLRPIGMALFSLSALTLNAHAQAPFGTYIGGTQNDSVIAVETGTSGAVHVLSYDGSGCVLTKLIPDGVGAWSNLYSYPLGPASCDAMAVAPTGDVLIGRTDFSNNTY